MVYECYVQFVPKGQSPRDADNIKTLKFKHDSLSKSDIISESYRFSDTRSGDVSPYALRNYFEVFEVEVKFDNPPWNGFEDLCGELLSYDEANNWKTRGDSLYISVDQGEQESYIKKVENYYSDLNPRKSSGKMVCVDTHPVLTE